MGTGVDHALAPPLGRQARLGGPQVMNTSSEPGPHPKPGPNPPSLKANQLDFSGLAGGQIDEVALIGQVSQNRKIRPALTEN